MRYLATDLHSLEDAVTLRGQIEAELGKPRTEKVIWYNRQNGNGHADSR